MLSNNCQHCGEALVGRWDKRFCDAQCRNAYHNRHKGALEKNIQVANKLIRRNRKILYTLCATGKATVRKDILDQLKFDFKLFTTIYPTQSGTYYFSYDYGLMPIIERGAIQKVLIIQWQEYMTTKPFDPWSRVGASA
jgi:hypothetical protein